MRDLSDRVCFAVQHGQEWVAQISFLTQVPNLRQYECDVALGDFSSSSIIRNQGISEDREAGGWRGDAMKKIKPVVVRNPSELAEALGLSPADAVEMEIRQRINEKIIAAVKRSGMTHAQVAASAGMSRTRLTAILNSNTSHVSTDLMLRILAAMGYRAKISFSRPGRAA